MARGDFHWDDPLLLDEQLTEEEKMVRDAAHDYAQGRLAPRILEAFRREHTDPSIFKEMGELGLLGASSASFRPLIAGVSFRGVKRGWPAGLAALG